MGTRAVNFAEQGIDVLGNIVLFGSLPETLGALFIVFERRAGDFFE